MLYLKSKDEITIIRKSAEILTKLHRELAHYLEPGKHTLVELDRLAETFIRDHGAEPSFKGYQGYPATLCTSVNSTVIHGIPNPSRLKDGDLISIDCGVCYKGYHSDAAITYPVGNVGPKLLTLLHETKQALYKAIEKATTAHTIGDIGHAVEKHLTTHNLNIIREYGGHGIGKLLHEEPHIPNYVQKKLNEKIQNGMVLAIEPIVTTGSGAIYDQGWSVTTQDGAPTAHFEHTVAIIDDKPVILTQHL